MLALYLRTQRLTRDVEILLHLRFVLLLQMVFLFFLVHIDEEFFQLFALLQHELALQRLLEHLILQLSADGCQCVQLRIRDLVANRMVTPVFNIFFPETGSRIQWHFELLRVRFVDQLERQPVAHIHGTL